MGLPAVLQYTVDGGAVLSAEHGGPIGQPSEFIQSPANRFRGEPQKRRTINMVDFLLRCDDFLLRRDEDGQGLAEYALILALIAIIAIAALIFLGGQISGILSTIGKQI